LKNIRNEAMITASNINTEEFPVFIHQINPTIKIKQKEKKVVEPEEKRCGEDI
jgi:hypothetical protein